MKQCFKCLESKPLSEFYEHGQMGDGYLGKCKVCTRRDVRAHRWANIDRIREAEKERGRNPRSIAKRTLTTRAWRQRYPERFEAQNAVNNALRDGRITRPDVCQVCGQKKRLHAHHHDYLKPFDVIWSCRVCHVQLDIERRKRECAT